MKNSFIIYYDYAEHFALLSDEELGRLIRAMFLYDKDGTLPQFDGMLKMAFSFIKTQLDIDKEKFEKVCERNRNNIKKRWNTKNTTGTNGIPDNTKNTDNDNENDNDNDNDNENDNDNDNDNENDNKSVCDKNARAKNFNCHLGSSYKSESCFYCMKKDKCPNAESADFKFNHPDESFVEWNKRKTDSMNQIIEDLKSRGKPVKMELFDYDWLNDRD